MFNAKVFVVELIGTFALVFVGSAAGMYNVGVLGVALAHGFTVAAMAYTFGYISGTHINPAVTLGLATNGNITWSEAVVYWLAQFTGGALAAFTLYSIVNLVNPEAFNAAATNGVLTTQYPYFALGLEALLTFFLMNAVLHTSMGDKTGPLGAWAIGTTLTIAILGGGPLTGASLNPARSFGPAIFTSVITPGTPDYQNYLLYLVYFIGPFLGAILAISLYQFLKSEPELEEEDDELEDGEIVEQVVVVEELVEEPMNNRED
jgi:MIP family channel proteins